MRALINLLQEPSIDVANVDGHERLEGHARMLARKPILRQVFSEFHHLFQRLDRQFFTARGTRVELGSGVAPMRDTYPDVLATDYVASAHLDRTLDAEAMDLPDQSVRVIFGQNCFHHFPHPDRFFSELERVLPVGGGAVLLEPYYGPFAGFLYKRIFTTEGFDKDFPSWETPVDGPMSGANQALSYIVFKRDRAEFEKRYPRLKIVHHEICTNYLKYLFSGGLNFRQLCPDWMAPVLSFFEWILRPFRPVFGLHHVVVLRKG